MPQTPCIYLLTVQGAGSAPRPRGPSTFSPISKSLGQMLRDAINAKLPYPCVSPGHGPWFVSASGRIKDWAPIMFYDPNGNHASVSQHPPSPGSSARPPPLLRGSLLAMVLQRASLVRGSHLSYARDTTFLTPTASSERLQGYPDSKRHQHQSLGMIKSSPEAQRLEDTYSRSRGQSELSLEPDSSHITLSPT